MENEIEPFADHEYEPKEIDGRMMLELHGREGKPKRIVAYKIPVLLDAIAEGWDIRVSRCTIEGDISLRKTNFKSDLQFYEVQFNGSVDFSEARFDGDADFRNAQFRERSDFTNAQFNGNAMFDDARFSQGAHFRGAHFNGNVELLADRFSGSSLSTMFFASISETYANFINARFLEFADFSHARFRGYVCFALCEFNGSAYFGDAQFTGYADFRDVRFIDDADFRNVFFNTSVNFAGAVVARPANFSAVSFCENTVLVGLWNLTLGKVRKLQSTVTSFLDFNTEIIMDGTSNPYLKRYINDEQWIASWRQRSWWHKVLFTIWELTSHCGRSIGLWAFWSVLVAVIFALIYRAFGSSSITFSVDMGGKPPDFRAYLYYSVVTFTTLGFGDIIPRTHWARFAVGAEVIFGYVMLGGLISIFANKFARRS